MKIRRYSNIYGKNDHTWLKIVIAFVAIALVVFLVFSIADPIAKLFSGDFGDDTSSEFNPTVSYASDTTSVPDNSDTPSTDISDNSQNASSEEPVVVRPDRTEYAAGLSVVLDREIVRNSEKFELFLQSAKAQGVENVIIELKDAEGYLYYKSNLKDAKNCKAISSNAITNLSAIIAKLRENGIAVTAKINCFSDRIATDIVDAAVKYQGDNGGKWLDDYKENGGKSWLNPYSDAAVNYLLDIAKELTNMGVDNVLLSSLRFPGGHQQFAYYGYDSTTVSREECLARFVSKMKSTLEYANSEVWVEVDMPHYLGQQPEIYGENPFEYGADCVVINLVAEDFGSSIFINNTTIQNPSKNYRDLIRTVIGKCQSMNTDGVDILALLQGYGYENEDVQNQIKEAKKYSATRYALEINGADIPLVK